MIENTIQKIKDLKNQYENAWKQIICPQRSFIDESMLGGDNLILQNNYYKKFDSFFVNSQHYKLRYTYYQNSSFKNNKIYQSLKRSIGLENEQKTCVVYFHAHQSNRIEGFNLLEGCAQRNYDLCLLDFQAQGQSEGCYVTLGIQEYKNILELFVQNIILWGRSMGAVSAIIAANNLPNQINLIGLVLDSPFNTVKGFLMGFLQHHYKMPQFLQNINKKIRVDFDSINVSEQAQKISNIPIVQVFSCKEQFIDKKDTLSIFEQFISKNKALFDCRLAHNEQRNLQIHKEIFNVFDQQLQKAQQNKINKTNIWKQNRERSRRNSIISRQSMSNMSLNTIDNSFKDNLYLNQTSNENLDNTVCQKQERISLQTNYNIFQSQNNASQQLARIFSQKQTNFLNQVKKDLNFCQIEKKQNLLSQAITKQQKENLSILESSFQMKQKIKNQYSLGRNSRRLRQKHHSIQSKNREHKTQSSNNQYYLFENYNLQKRLTNFPSRTTQKNSIRIFSKSKFNQIIFQMNTSTKKRIFFKDIDEDHQISLDGPPLDFSNLELQNLEDLIEQDSKKAQKKDQETNNQIGEDIYQNQENTLKRRQTLKLINVAKQRSTFNNTVQSKQSYKNFQPKKEDKVLKLKPIDNIKKVIENCDTDLETDKVHQKAIQKNKKKKVILKTTSLFIGYNQIKSIKNCTQIFKQLMPNCLYDLQWLDLQHNQIEQLDQSLSELKNLKTLYLHCNFIFDLNEFLKLNGLTKLRSLMVHGNPIVRIPNFRYYFIEIFPNLKKLDTVLVTNKERDNTNTWIHQFKQRKLPCYNIEQQNVS